MMPPGLLAIWSRNLRERPSSKETDAKKIRFDEAPILGVRREQEAGSAGEQIARPLALAPSGGDIDAGPNRGWKVPLLLAMPGGPAIGRPFRDPGGFRRPPRQLEHPPIRLDHIRRLGSSCGIRQG